MVKHNCKMEHVIYAICIFALILLILTSGAIYLSIAKSDEASAENTSDSGGGDEYMSFDIENQSVKRRKNAINF